MGLRNKGFRRTMRPFSERKDLRALINRRLLEDFKSIVASTEPLKFGIINSFSISRSYSKRSLATINDLSGSARKRRRLIQHAKKVIVTSFKGKILTGSRRSKWQQTHNNKESE